MSDARALLRQQREARRINHPHASYSSSGALLCLACRVPVKTESRWEAHLKSDQHKVHAQQLAAKESPQPQPQQAHEQSQQQQLADDEDDQQPGAKRKHGSDTDDAGNDSEGPKPKRSRADLKNQLTPPTLTRRSSTTPSQGVEMQIPSRPATPRDPPSNGSGSGSGSSTNGLTLIPGPPLQKTAGDSSKQAEKQEIDEGEWANFEADINSLSYDTGATISAPVMSASEAAAAAAAAASTEQEKEQESANLEDEREEAARALEEEFDEMQSLEAKVLKLKEKREGIRQRAVSSGQMEKTDGVVAKQGKENVEAVVEEYEDEEESSDEEDDWDGFRFRAGVAR